MNENDIKIINTSIHKKLTDNHLAQINFTAELPTQLWQQYCDKTNSDEPSLARIRFMGWCAENKKGDKTIVFGRVSHGYGYDIAQDIFNSIMYSKGVK